MVRKITLERLDDVATYNTKRNAFRQAVMAHKQPRRVALGDHLCLYFEDLMTMLYQVQEMIRAEKLTSEVELQEELNAYNPLIPDGSNWKATMMIEYTDEAERKQALSQLVGIEQQLWVQVGDQPRVYAIANEDLSRSTEEKTSAVHFLRFELSEAMVSGAKRGDAIRFGCDHPLYPIAPTAVSEATASSLIRDLQ